MLPSLIVHIFQVRRYQGEWVILADILTLIQTEDRLCMSTKLLLALPSLPATPPDSINSYGPFILVGGEFIIVYNISGVVER